MPVKITYIGPHRSLDDQGDVWIPDSDQWAKAGEPIEVESDLAEQLLDQPGNWARANTKAAKTAAEETGGK